jgi:hypothetical protein
MEIGQGKLKLENGQHIVNRNVLQITTIHYFLHRSILSSFYLIKIKHIHTTQEGLKCSLHMNEIRQYKRKHSTIYSKPALLWRFICFTKIVLFSICLRNNSPMSCFIKNISNLLVLYFDFRFVRI